MDSYILCSDCHSAVGDPEKQMPNGRAEKTLSGVGRMELVGQVQRDQSDLSFWAKGCTLCLNDLDGFAWNYQVTEVIIYIVRSPEGYELWENYPRGRGQVKGQKLDYRMGEALYKEGTESERIGENTFCKKVRRPLNLDQP